MLKLRILLCFSLADPQSHLPCCVYSTENLKHETTSNHLFPHLLDLSADASLMVGIVVLGAVNLNVDMWYFVATSVKIIFFQLFSTFMFSNV